MSSIPKFEELPYVGETQERHAWEVFGLEDQMGSVNLLTPEKVKRAARLIRTGQVFNLSLPLDSQLHSTVDFGAKAIDTISKSVEAAVTTMLIILRCRLNQWDSLRHIRFREYGYYGGRQDVDLDEKGELGIEHWAQHGIVGRGVVLDGARYMEQQQTPLDMTKKFEMDGAFLEQVAREQKVQLEPGRYPDSANRLAGVV